MPGLPRRVRCGCNPPTASCRRLCKSTWSRGTKVQNVPFKSLHVGGSQAYRRGHQGLEYSECPSPVIYISNELLEFKEPGANDLIRRWHIETRKIEIVSKFDYIDPESQVLKDPLLKKRLPDFVDEFVDLLIEVARGCDIVIDDKPFPSPTGSDDMVERMGASSGAGQVKVDVEQTVDQFYIEKIELCPVGCHASSREEVAKELCAYAFRKGVKVTRTQLAGLLASRFEIPAKDVAVKFPAWPKSRTYKCYVYPASKGPAQRCHRMCRLREPDEKPEDYFETEAKHEEETSTTPVDTPERRLLLQQQQGPSEEAKKRMEKAQQKQFFKRANGGT